MFAVIYQGYLKPDREPDYLAAWRKIANYFVEHRGALGSALHQAEDGRWVAYSRWPDRAMRDASWPGDQAPSHELPPDIREAILTIKECLDTTRPIPDLCMELIDDLFP